MENKMMERGVYFMEILTCWLSELNLEPEQIKYLFNIVKEKPVGQTETRYIFESKKNNLEEEFNKAEYYIKVQKRNIPFNIERNQNLTEYKISEYLKDNVPSLYKWINPISWSLFDSNIIVQEKCEKILLFSDLPFNIPIPFRSSYIDDYVWRNGVCVLNNYCFVNLRECVDYENKEEKDKFISREYCNPYHNSRNHEINEGALKRALHVI